MKVSTIEISFPVPVDVPDTFSRDLCALLDRICEDYQKANPTRVMWPAGFGSKPKWSQQDAAFLGKTPDPDAPEIGEPTFDDSVFHIEIAEREDLHGTNLNNPANCCKHGTAKGHCPDCPDMAEVERNEKAQADRRPGTTGGTY
jgi:hypothetical protein